MTSQSAPLPADGFLSLPQELVDNVIEHNQDDPATLYACALVNSTWTYPAQSALFARVHFYHHSGRVYRAKPTKNSHRIDRFCELITSYPHLAALVRSVEVEPLIDASQEACLGLVLSKFTNLKRISLDLAGYYWDELSQCMRDALLTTFRSPNITNVELREGLFFRCADFLALLGACEHLKRLSLYYMSCDDLEDVLNAPEESLTTLPKGINLQLDSLTLGLYENSYLSLMHRLLQLGESMDLSHLHRLSVLTAGTGHLQERIETTKEILKLNSHSLEHLVLNVCLGEPLAKLIDVSQLRSIQVKLWWVRMRSDQQTDSVVWLKWLAETFNDLAKHRVVEEVAFEVFYSASIASHVEEWHALDKALSQISSLTRVSVGLDCYDCTKGRWKYHTEYPKTVATDVKFILPLVSQRGILTHEVAANYPS
ncbi:hypothetical protein CYLTODRAFT_447691 [Cylindrobasidium torrendii FP15055 ss-10]|uniref:F-box domain-containing protein n=1 Tax=Cylindrobasidium torrendii FP15055 ss-10 TaxID=1314674 RepID=A0A0D7ASZ3_9AGAR|nr:hypothetical protein CYLTODRAFT_447691 [Cylindrobasidium torrendii FP15055 ss-10]